MALTYPTAYCSIIYNSDLYNGPGTKSLYVSVGNWAAADADLSDA